jgi:hypothetical protein
MELLLLLVKLLYCTVTSRSVLVVGSAFPVPCRDGAIAKILYLAELFLSLLYFSGRYGIL